MLLLVVVLVAVATALLQATPTPALGTALRDRLAVSLRGPGLPPGRTGAIAVDLGTGRVLYAHNGRRAVPPASNEKIPVAWAALVRLGAGYRLVTEVYVDGERTGGVLEGDLVLRGGGDPTLREADLERLARAVRAAGIRRITGRVRGDETAFDTERAGPSWKEGFLGFESPPLSALVVDRGEGWPALSPPLLAAKMFRKTLAEAGVTAGKPGLGRAPKGTLPLAVHQSAPLAKLLVPMLRDSDNFTAEMLLKALGASVDGRGSSKGGAEVVMETMAEYDVPTSGVSIVDGSGLSPDDRLTPIALAAVYAAAVADDDVRPAFLAALARPGREGTLETRLGDLRTRVRGKTGTTSISCSLSGVVNGDVAFVVIETGSPVRAWEARAAQDRFVSVLAER